jgi:hypothetical protein
MIRDRQLREALQVLAEVLTQACGDRHGLLRPGANKTWHDAIQFLQSYGAAEYLGRQATDRSNHEHYARIIWQALQEREGQA